MDKDDKGLDNQSEEKVFLKNTNLAESGKENLEFDTQYSSRR